VVSNEKVTIPQGTTRLLLVEGPDERQFFISLASSILPSDKPLFYIMVYDGKNKLSKFLSATILSDSFDKITHLGIVRDADFGEKSFVAVQDILRNINDKRAASKLPIPTQAEVFEQGVPKVGIFIMPDAHSEGMLENLIWNALKDQPIAPCVDAYFECLKEKGIIPKAEALPKARVRVLESGLYQAKTHTLIQGNNVDQDTKAADRNRHYLTDLYAMSWWSWDHAAFADVKNFVRALVAD
jgi:hypothetical protein